MPAHDQVLEALLGIAALLGLLGTLVGLFVVRHEFDSHKDAIDRRLIRLEDEVDRKRRTRKS